MSVRCGNCAEGTNPYHPTVEDVRECYMYRYEVENEYDADAAYERHLENAGWAEAALQDLMEARNGVISFEDAYAMAMGQPVDF